MVPSMATCTVAPVQLSGQNTSTRMAVEEATKWAGSRELYKCVSRWDNACEKVAYLRNEARVFGVGDENGRPLIYFQIPEGQRAVVQCQNAVLA